MTKELTEKWKNGTLEEGWYYLLYDVDESDSDCDYWNGSAWHFDYPPAIEVLALVPTYQEHLESEAHCAVYSEINEWNKEKIEQLESKLSCISEQLNEANEVIKFYSDAHQLTEEEKQMTAEKYHLVYGLKAIEYLEKWELR